LTVHFSGCILAPLSLPYAATWLVCENECSAYGYSLSPTMAKSPARYRKCFLAVRWTGRLPNSSSFTETQSSSAATLRGEMGLFPFASTVGSMSNWSTDLANAHTKRNPRDAWHSARCWRPNGPDRTRHRLRSPSSSDLYSHPSDSASCSGAAPRPAGHSRPRYIRRAGGERRPTVERGPP
jgi:hypothetical protein